MIEKMRGNIPLKFCMLLLYTNLREIKSFFLNFLKKTEKNSGKLDF